MKRLLNSSKFLLAVIGTIVAWATWWQTKDTTFAMYVSGLYGVVIGGHTAKDIFIKRNDVLTPSVDPDKEFPDEKG